MEGEEGAVAVIVAVLMTALLGMGAVVIDVGALYGERRQLQNGADAAALAIAQRCASGDCGDVDGLAQQLADANANDGLAAVRRVDVAGGLVTVELSTRTDDGQELTHVLAPILGFDGSAVFAASSAGWGGPAGGPTQLPLAISWCSFAAQTGGGLPSTTVEHTINYLDEAGESCTSPSGHTIPGGFGWLETDPGACHANTAIATDQTPSKPGVSVPSDCDGTDFEALQNQTVLLPVFSESGGSGSEGWFKIHGYAAFHLTGYRFACPAAYRWNDGQGACGSNSERLIKGYFTRFVSPSDAFQLGGPDLGGRIVALRS